MEPVTKGATRAFTWIIAGAILLGAVQMLQLTLPYLALKPRIDFLKTKVFIYHIVHWRISFYVHVFTGIFALLAGLIQFSGCIIARWPKVHRIAGYIYVTNILAVTGPAALVMSLYANGGWTARSSFTLQSLLWIFATGMALKRAFEKQFLSHGHWMLRSYALTLAALTLRSYAALLSFAGSDLKPVDKYILIAWASWVPNLILAEVLFHTGFIKRIMNKRASNNGQSLQ